MRGEPSILISFEFPKRILKLVVNGAIIHVFPGDYGGVEPPVPIPNTEVKRPCADDTALS